MEKLQTTTQEELVTLKTRLSQLEGFVGKLYVAQKEANTSARSSAIYNTSYLASFQPHSRTSERYADNGRGTTTSTSISKEINSTKRVNSPVQGIYLFI